MDTEVNLQAFLEPVSLLAIRLRDWGRKFLAPADANRAVRLTLADLFYLACNGWATESGPWSEAVQICGGHIQRCPRLSSGDAFLMNGGPDHVPDEPELRALCTTYSIVYELAYLTRWTLSDRMDINNLLRSYDLRAPSDSMIAAFLNSSDMTIIPLRCAVHAVERHRSGEELICAVTSDIETVEVDKSLSWLMRVKEIRGEV